MTIPSSTTRRSFVTTEARTCLLCGRAVRLAQLGLAIALLDGHERGDTPHVCERPIRLSRVGASSFPRDP